VENFFGLDRIFNYFKPPPSPPPLQLTSINYISVNNKFYSITLHLLDDDNNIVSSNNIYSNDNGFTIIAKSWESDGTEWKEFGDGWGGPGKHGTGSSFKWTQGNKVAYSPNNGHGFSVPVGTSTRIELEIFNCKASITLNIIPPPPRPPSLSPSLSISNQNNIYNIDFDLPQNISKSSPASLELINSTTNQSNPKNIPAPNTLIDDYKISNKNPTFLAESTGSGSSTDPYKVPDLMPNTNVILPYIVDGKTLKIDNSIIVRTNGKLTVTINNISKSYNIGDSFIINDKIYKVNAIEDFNNNIIEHLPGISLTVTSVPPVVTNNPTHIYDYIFYLCYPVSFLGALFYGIVSIISVDPSSILINKNWSVAFNIYVGLCAIMSVFIWFNYPNFILGKAYNQKSYKKSLR